MHCAVKVHIANVLRGVTSLKVRQPCSRMYRASSCPDAEVRDWLDEWTDVKLEHRIGTFVPDLALYRGDRLLGMIEVFVTHEVDDAKIARLQSADHRWVEVVAHEVMDGDRVRWTGNQPLPIGRSDDTLRFTCTTCRRADAADHVQCREVAAVLHEQVLREKRWSYLAPCDPSVAKELFAYETWSHLATPDIGKANVLRWIRDMSWPIDKDSCRNPMLAHWPDVTEAECDQGEVGDVRPVVVRHALGRTGFVFLAAARSLRLRKVRHAVRSLNEPWVIIDPSEAGSLRYRRAIDGEPKVTCGLCVGKAQRFRKVLTAAPSDHVRVIKIKTAALRLRLEEDPYASGFIAVEVERKGGKDRHVRVTVMSLEDDAPEGSGWRWRGGPSPENGLHIRDAIAAWRHDLEQQGVIVELGKWQDYVGQDFQSDHPLAVAVPES